MAEKMERRLPPRIEQRIEAHLAVAERMKNKPAGEKKVTPFVTITRQYGCGAMDLADMLAERLEDLEGVSRGTWHVYNHQIIDDISSELHLTDRLLEALDVQSRGGIEEFFQTLIAQSPPDIEILHHLVRVVRAIALHGRCIIVGRGGPVLTRELAGGVHIRLTAPEKWRMGSLVNRFGWDEAKAHRLLHEEETHRRTFFQKYLGHDVGDPDLYDLTINAAHVNREEQIETVVSLFRKRFGFVRK